MKLKEGIKNKLKSKEYISDVAKFYDAHPGTCSRWFDLDSVRLTEFPAVNFFLNLLKIEPSFDINQLYDFDETVESLAVLGIINYQLFIEQKVDREIEERLNQKYKSHDTNNNSGVHNSNITDDNTVKGDFALEQKSE